MVPVPHSPLPPRRSLLRWLPTFLAFPAAGLLTSLTVGPVDSVASALAGGALAGAVIGGAQWLALRTSGVGRAWWAATVAATALASAAAVALSGAGTTAADLTLRGLVTGAAVGLAQSLATRRRPPAVLAWTAVTASAWGVGWWVTSHVIVDAERGYVTFGSSGALLATLLTGAALRLVVPGIAATTSVTTPGATTVTLPTEVVGEVTR
jgi:hypothetical protein